MRSAAKFAAIVLASVFAVAGAGCTMLQGEQSAGEYVDDATLTARVKAALLDNEQVAGTQINVDAYQGQITLSGFADSEEERRTAEQIARQVPGVQSVQSNIRLAGVDQPEQPSQERSEPASEN